jgi:hypothetical protein
MSILAISPNQYNENNIKLSEPRVNCIIDGFFSKITFSDEMFVMQGLTLCVPVCENTIYAEHISTIDVIEQSLLGLYSKSMRLDTNRISTLLKSKYKICNITPPQGLSNNLLIKISGVWENKRNEIGLSFKCVTI